ncbi:MAG TPA: GFA family protein [Vineibacter sp.]|nr:GFA family protein [Vineibacter sp.]
MVEASCHCGAVRLQIDAAPTEVTDCNCSICRRYGTLWAYYAPRQVQWAGATDIYLCHDKVLEFHRCAVCGCVTHWSAIDPSLERMGVNTRLMDPQVLVGIKVRRLDGADTWEYLD